MPHAPHTHPTPSGSSPPASAPDGVLACGCTTNVVDDLLAQAGLPRDRQRAQLWADIEAHVAPHLGPLEGVLHDAEPGQTWGDLLVHRPTDERPTIDIVSAGVSARRMRRTRALRKRGVPARAEFILRFPEDWAATSTVSETILSRDGAWIVLWMQVLARAPFMLNTFFGDEPGLEVQERLFPMELHRKAPFDAVLAANPARFGPAFPSLNTIDGPRPTSTSRAPARHSRSRSRSRRPGDDVVRFLSLIPLYREEFEFALRNGHQRLFERLETAGVTDVVRVGRARVV